MSKREITDLDVSLAHLRAIMLLQYGGTIITAKREEEKREAFTSVIMCGIELIAGAICSRRPHDEALQITIEQFPAMLKESVEVKIELMSKIEAGIQRQGATVQ